MTQPQCELGPRLVDGKVAKLSPRGRGATRDLLGPLLAVLPSACTAPQTLKELFQKNVRGLALGCLDANVCKKRFAFFTPNQLISQGLEA